MTNKLDSGAIDALIWIDQASDYVPGVSTITNLVDIFEKFAFTGCCDSNSIESNGLVG